MADNGSKFAWTGQRERAALLLAEDELSDEKIAEHVGIGSRTLWRWKTYPEFTDRIAEHVRCLRV